MNTKLILLGLSTLVELSRAGGSQASSVEILKYTIRIETSKILYKFLIAAVVAVVAMLSAYRFFAGLGQLYGNLNEGIILQILTFGSIVLFCILAIFLILDTRKEEKLIAEHQKESVNQMDLQKAIQSFADGFATALERAESKNSNY